MGRKRANVAAEVPSESSEVNGKEEEQLHIKKKPSPANDQSTDSFDSSVSLPRRASAQTLTFEEAENVVNRRLANVLDSTRAALVSKLESFKEMAHAEIDEQVASLREELMSTIIESAETERMQPERSGQALNRGMRRKVHIAKESVITRMMKEDSYQTIFNIVVAALIAISLNLVIADYKLTGTFTDLSLMSWGFEGFPLFMFRWVCMFGASFVALPLAHFAAISTGVFKKFWIIVYSIVQLGMFVMSATFCDGFHTPLRVAVLAEQARLSMKMHAYWREKLLWDRMHHSTQPVTPVTSDYVTQEVQLFFYFLWAPTLVYRVSYPRTAHIRWSAVALRALECAGSIYYTYLVFRWVLPNFQRASSIDSWSSFFINWIGCMGPGMALMFLAHYLVLHNLQNMFAELTRFADRGFYEDWWNARTWAVFYRKWNGVVHDFIKEYAYLDFHELGGYSRTKSMAYAFLISAIIHEFIISFIFGFFYPILLLLFGGPGMLFIALTRSGRHRIWNVFLWLMLGAGNGLMMVLYCVEWYARAEAPPPTTWKEFLIPASWKNYLA